MFLNHVFKSCQCNLNVFEGLHFNRKRYSRYMVKSYHCEVLYHSTIHSSFMEVVFILRQTDIIQPA